MSKHKPRVLIDVDGVLADFQKAFIDAVMTSCVRTDITHDWVPQGWDLAEELRLTNREEDIVYGLLSEPGVARNMKLLPGALDGVKKLLPKADVYFITSPLERSPTWVYDRDRWLRKHFGEAQGKKVGNIHDKFIVAGDILIDDKPKNCAEWADAWPLGQALMWSNTCNLAHDVPNVLRVHSWQAIELMVDLAMKKMEIGKGFRLNAST